MEFTKIACTQTTSLQPIFQKHNVKESIFSVSFSGYCSFLCLGYFCMLDCNERAIIYATKSMKMQFLVMIIRSDINQRRSVCSCQSNSLILQHSIFFSVGFLMTIFHYDALVWKDERRIWSLLRIHLLNLNSKNSIQLLN